MIQAMQLAAQSGKGGYSPPAGLPELREAIAGFYTKQLGAKVDPHRVIVTSGASGALLLAAMALVNPGDEVLMPDPCYPPNRFLQTFEPGGVGKAHGVCGVGRPKIQACHCRDARTVKQSSRKSAAVW